MNKHLNSNSPITNFYLAVDGERPIESFSGVLEPVHLEQHPPDRTKDSAQGASMANENANNNQKSESSNNNNNNNNRALFRFPPYYNTRL